MGAFWNGVWDIWATISFLGTIVAIVVCFTKGRAWFGWFGVFMTGAGIALWFEMFRMIRSTEISQLWLVLFHGQGLAVLALLTVIALQPAKDGSWWYRRQMTGAATSRTLWGVSALILAGLATWLIVANVIWNMAQGGVPVWPVVVIGAVVAAGSAMLGFWLLRHRTSARSGKGHPSLR